MTPEAMLERRYRQLLWLYPREHRREYGEEMVGVLLADSAPGQRGPGPREVLDVVVSAFTVRWLRGSGVLRDESWVRAARAAQVFGAMLLCAVALRRIATEQALALRYPEYPPSLSGSDLRPVAWALVLVLVMAGWRWAAVPAALGGLVIETLTPIERYLDTPAQLLNVFWFLVAAAVVAAASLMTALSARASPSVTGRLPRGTTLVALAGVLIVLSDASAELLHGWHPDWPILESPGLILGRPLSYSQLAFYAAVALLVALGVSRLPRPVIRRAVVLAVPIVVSGPLIPVAFGDLIEHNLRNPESTLLVGPAGWAVLVVVPLAAMRVAATLNRRLERGRAESSSG